MLIPMRCFTCGKMLSDKWDYYQEKVNERKNNQKEKNNSLINFTSISNIEKTIEGHVLDELGLTII